MANDATRRDVLLTGVLAAAGLTWADLAAGQELPPTPQCDEAGSPTPRQTEGPFYKPRSPERADLREPGMGGRTVVLAGTVLTRACRPVSGALVDLWHADGNGDYDQRGDRCRGHQFTDARGGFRFRTIVPEVYPGRTRHYHVKVQARDRPVLTTQLYFPDEPANARDRLFRRELLMRTARAEGGLAARFDFVLDLR